VPAGSWKMEYRGVCRTLTPGFVVAYDDSVAGTLGVGGSSLSGNTLLLDDTTGVTDQSRGIGDTTGGGQTQEWYITRYFTTDGSSPILVTDSAPSAVHVVSGTAPNTFGVGTDIFFFKLPSTLTQKKKKVDMDETEMMKLFDKWATMKDKASSCSTPVIVQQDVKGVTKKWDNSELSQMGIEQRRAMLKGSEIVGVTMVDGERVVTRAVDDTYYAKLFGAPKRAKSLERDQKDDVKNQTKKDDKGKG